MRTIAVSNLKGGVGKTTISFNVAAALAELGHRVLLIDADAQGCLTDCLSLRGKGHATLAEILRGQATAATAAQATPVRGLLAVSASAALDDINRRNLCGESVLHARRMTEVDYTIIDCPGHAGVVLLNALIAADEVICPVLARGMADQGLERILQIIRDIRSRGAKSELDLTGIIISQFDERTRIARGVIDRLQAKYEGLVLESMIHESVRLAECTDAGTPIMDHAPESRAAEEVRELAREIVQRSAARQGYTGISRERAQSQLSVVHGGAAIPAS